MINEREREREIDLLGHVLAFGGDIGVGVELGSLEDLKLIAE